MTRIFSKPFRRCLAAATLLGVMMPATMHGEPRPQLRESFDSDPDWDGFRNRLLPDPLPQVRQDFGYRTSNFAGGQRAGEIGGLIQRAHSRAYYAIAIPTKSLQDHLFASGKFAVTSAGGGSAALIGWFNHNTSQGWRTPDSLAFRLDGNGDKYWVFFEYGTSQRGTGSGGAFEGQRYQTTSTQPFPADGTVHSWSLDYDPEGANGDGRIRFHIDDRSYEVAMSPGHKDEHGATFNRFGIWNQQTAGRPLTLFMDDLEVDGEKYTFDENPGWVQDGNPASYPTRVIRPYHDFGFTNTSYAGGQSGEIGGIVFRDEQPMYYGDEVGPFSLDDELTASGKIAFRSAGADSAVSLGWFDSKAKRSKSTPEHIEPQTGYLGMFIEGPSRVGHYFRAAYSTSGTTRDAPTQEGTPEERPVIHPSDKVHSWSLHYDPEAADGRGRITVTFDNTTHHLDLKEDARSERTTFDRFGFYNTQSGGHHVEVYVDDLSYSK